jgi:nitroreductase / dihydropteridine reductase
MVENKIIEALNWRYATKKFDSSKKLSEKDLSELIEVLRLSASSFGLQLWKFVVVNNVQTREKIQAAAWNQSQIVDASNLIVLCAKNDFTEADVKEFIELNEKEKNLPAGSLKEFEDMLHGHRKSRDANSLKEWMKRQVYIALGKLLTASALKKIDACPMEGFDPVAVNKILDLDKKGYTSVVMCTLGHRSSEDKYASAKKVRYPAEKIVEFVN